MELVGLRISFIAACSVAVDKAVEGLLQREVRLQGARERLFDRSVVFP
jgi:hypothetical protein